MGRRTLEEAPGQRGFRAQPPLPGPGWKAILPLPSCARAVRGLAALREPQAALGFGLDTSISKFAARRVPEGRLSPSTRCPSVACLQPDV